MKPIVLDLDKIYEHYCEISNTEIKKEVQKFKLDIDCFECEEEQSVHNEQCKNCYNSPNLINNFKIKAKKNEFDKFFFGAPVMVRQPRRAYAKEGVWGFTYYKPGDFLVKNIYKLPDLKQCPVNTWLIPWLEPPIDELKKLTIAIRYDNFIEVKYPDWTWESVNWDNVTSIMILESLK